MIDLLHDIEEALVGLGHMRKKRKVKSMKAKREASKERREECEEGGNEENKNQQNNNNQMYDVCA